MKLRLIWVVILMLSFGGFASAAIETSNCPTGTAAYMKMDGDLSDEFSEFSVSHLGGPNPSTASPSMGIVGNSMNISGRESIDTTNVFKDAGTNGFSIVMWYQNLSSPYLGILLRSEGYVIGVDSLNGFVNFSIIQSGGAGTITAGGSYDKFSPAFFAFTFDGTDLKIYTANDSSSSSISGTLDSKSISSSLQNTNRQNPSVLRGGAVSMPAHVDELAFFIKELSLSEVLRLYTLSKGGNHYCIGSSEDFSSIQSNFSIAGCSTYYFGKNYNVASGSCSNDGYIFCRADGKLYKTIEDERGCSKGSDSWSTGTDMCCPKGLICQESSSGAKDWVCDTPKVECRTFLDSSSCNDEGCYWIDSTIGCINSPSELGCSVYTTSSACTQDTFNLGGEGFGTGVCDSFNGFYDWSNITLDLQLIVPPKSCKCDWDISQNRCELIWNLEESLYPSKALQNQFECDVHYNFADCVAGEQKINWTVEVEGINGSAFGNPTTLNSIVLGHGGCEEGEIIRDCGAPVVKLPGFSLFAFTLSSLLIGLFYLVRLRGFKNNL